MPSIKCLRQNWSGWFLWVLHRRSDTNTNHRHRNTSYFWVFLAGHWQTKRIEYILPKCGRLLRQLSRFEPREDILPKCVRTKCYIYANGPDIIIFMFHEEKKKLSALLRYDFAHPFELAAGEMKWYRGKYGPTNIPRDAFHSIYCNRVYVPNSMRNKLSSGAVHFFLPIGRSINVIPVGGVVQRNTFIRRIAICGVRCACSAACWRI